MIASRRGVDASWVLLWTSALPHVILFLLTSLARSFVFDQPQSLVIVTLLSFWVYWQETLLCFFSCRDGSDEDADFDLNKDPTPEQVEGLAEREAVCLYLNVIIYTVYLNVRGRKCIQKNLDVEYLLHISIIYIYINKVMCWLLVGYSSYRDGKDFGLPNASYDI